jgi:hypothetical protein
VLDSTTDLYRIDALLLFVVSWRFCDLPFGCALFLFSSFPFDVFDGVLLRCSTRLPTLTGSMLCPLCGVMDCVAVYPLVLFLFLLLTFLFDIFDGALLRCSTQIRRSGLASYRLRTFLPFFALDVTILCFASFLTLDAGGSAGMFLATAHRFSIVVFHNVVSFVFFGLLVFLLSLFMS